MRHLLGVVVLLAMSDSLSLAGAPPADPGQNAALRYWQAFEGLGQMQPDPADYLDADSLKPLDDAARLLLNQRQASLLYLRRGAAQPSCDWGLHLEDGPGLLLPHIQKSRDLARLACLSMRRHFEEGRPHEALEDLGAVLMLARNLGADHTMIAMLVQFAIESLAYQSAAPYLMHLDAKGLEALAARLNKLPPTATLRRSIELENEHMIGWLIGQIKKKIDPQVIEKIMGGEGSFTVVFKLKGEEGAIKELEGLQKDYKELVKILALPRAEQRAKQAELMKKMVTNQFGKLLIPAIEKVQAAEDKMEVRRALFRAAIALAGGGADAARQVKDPAGDGPFEVTKLDRGYELRSKLVDKDKPVSLKVGTMKK
jgi:hypothetical protein